MQSRGSSDNAEGSSRLCKELAREPVFLALFHVLGKDHLGADWDLASLPEDSYENFCHIVDSWDLSTPPKLLFSGLAPQSVSAQTINSVVFTHVIFDAWGKHQRIDNVALYAVLAFKKVLAKQLFLFWQGKPNSFELCLAFLDSVGGYIARWYPDLGGSAQKDIDEVHYIVDELLESRTDFDKALSQAMGHWQKYCEKKEKKLAAVNERLSTMMVGSLSTREAQQICCGLVSEAVAGRTLPSPLAEFFSGPWLESLQFIYLNEGEKSSLWRKAHAATSEILALLFHEKEHPADALGNTSDVVRQCLKDQQHSDEKVEEWVASVVSSIYQENVVCDTAISLPEKGIESQTRVVISENIIRKAKAFIPGDWFSFNGLYEGRAQILLISESGTRYVFSNLVGQKAFEFSLDEFAYLLANGSVKELPSGPLMSRILTRVITISIEKYHSHSQKEVAIEVARKEAKMKAMREAEEARLARIEMEEKLLSQKKSQEEEVGRLKNENKKIETEKYRLEMEKFVNGMEEGISMFIPEEDGNEEKLTFVARLNSTNKLIFTNELGLKRIEFRPDELVSQIVEGKISLESTRFERRLS